MIELAQVTKRYGGTTVVAETTLRADPGKNTVLIGPSGCGKSTLIRMMIGLIRPDSGQVAVDGEPLNYDNLGDVRRRMGYVIQSGGLFPHLTAEENVVVMAKRLGWDRPRMAARLADLADLTRFPAAALSRYPGEMSGGQRQRVSLMRALMLDPAALLLDEPLGALDPLVRAELQEDLRNIFRTLQKTVVLVTHDLGEAWFFGDKIVLMRGGSVLQEGTLQDLVRSPNDEFVTKFINAQRSPLEGVGEWRS